MSARRWPGAYPGLSREPGLEPGLAAGAGLRASLSDQGCLGLQSRRLSPVEHLRALVHPLHAPLVGPVRTRGQLGWVTASQGCWSWAGAHGPVNTRVRVCVQTRVHPLG